MLVFFWYAAHPTDSYAGLPGKSYSILFGQGIRVMDTGGGPTDATIHLDGIGAIEYATRLLLPHGETLYIATMHPLIRDNRRITVVYNIARERLQVQGLSVTGTQGDFRSKSAKKTWQARLLSEEVLVPCRSNTTGPSY